LVIILEYSIVIPEFTNSDKMIAWVIGNKTASTYLARALVSGNFPHNSFKPEKINNIKIIFLF